VSLACNQITLSLAPPPLSFPFELVVGLVQVLTYFIFNITRQNYSLSTETLIFFF